MDRKKITQQLLDDKKIVEYGGQYFPNSPKNPGTAKFAKIRNMTSSENAVIVMGPAKSGSHLAMSILDALGVDRAEELGVENGITPFPFEFQDRFWG